MRTITVRLAARLEVNKNFPDVHLERVKGVRDQDGTKLWLESTLWAAETFNYSATSANVGMLFSHEVFYGGQPSMPLIPFFHPA